MKRSTFASLFIGTQIVIILLYIHKQNLFIKNSYELQKYEIEQEHLRKQKQELTHQLQTVHDRSSVKKFAAEKLSHLKPVKISQIKKIAHDTNT